MLKLGVRKNIKKPIKSRKSKNNNRIMKKKPIKPIRIFKKLTGSIRFYKPETKKTKPNQTQTQTQKNRAKPNQTGKNRAGRFEPIVFPK